MVADVAVVVNGDVVAVAYVNMHVVVVVIVVGRCHWRCRCVRGWCCCSVVSLSLPSTLV